jgi:tellurite resistance protein
MGDVVWQRDGGDRWRSPVRQLLEGRRRFGAYRNRRDRRVVHRLALYRRPGDRQDGFLAMNSMRRPVPLNLFGIPFGLLGLADCWLVAATFHLASVTIGRVLVGVAVVVWGVVGLSYVRGIRAHRVALGDELANPIAGPFASLAVITPMLAAADALYPLSHTAGSVIVDVLIVATVLLAGWFTGQWIYRPLELSKVHPGYFLPSVAGGFVASASAGLIGQRGLAEMLFGLGLVSWIVRVDRAGSPRTGACSTCRADPDNRNRGRSRGGRDLRRVRDRWAPRRHGGAAARGYGLLMVIAQVRLLPAYLRLSFMPSFWAFTFSWAAVTFAGLTWLGVTRPTAWRAESYVALALISAFIGAIAARTALALQRGNLLPTPSPATASGPVAPVLPGSAVSR